jgi:hypothetical protein
VCQFLFVADKNFPSSSNFFFDSRFLAQVPVELRSVIQSLFRASKTTQKDLAKFKEAAHTKNAQVKSEAQSAA